MLRELKKTVVKGEKIFKILFPVDGHDMQVCQTFFLHTLSISHQTVQSHTGQSNNKWSPGA